LLDLTQPNRLLLQFTQQYALVTRPCPARRGRRPYLPVPHDIATVVAFVSHHDNHCIAAYLVRELFPDGDLYTLVYDALVAKLVLERGWHSYEFNAPKTAIMARKNEVQFFYDYPESPKSRGPQCR
jgi:hypothetical protein